MASKNYIFYKIFKEDLDEIYVGSTANFDSRKKSHKHHCNNETCKQYNYKIYQTIRTNGGWDEFKMIQIGTRENITKREAEQIEEEYRLELKGNLNMRRAFLTPELSKEYGKEYYEQNKVHVLEKHKEYRQTNKEKINEKNKEYRQTNKEKINEKNKEYRQTNKEKISEKGKEKVICEICNIEITRGSKAKHLKSQRHINNI
jgi:hypothetical protein